MENPINYWRRNLTPTEFVVWMCVTVVYAPLALLRLFRPDLVTGVTRVVEGILPLFVVYLALRAKRKEDARRGVSG